LRGYIAYKILKQKGFENIKNLSGGYLTYFPAIQKQSNTGIFDYEKNTFSGKKKTRAGDIEKVSGDIPGHVQDIFSSLYYVRTQDLQVGKTIELDVNTRKNWPLYVNVLKRETIKVEAGKFDCFVVEPKLRDKGLFVQKGKSLKVWITADKHRIPVKMEAEVMIGSVEAELIEYENKELKILED
jgi:hypothetical protein